MTVSPFEQFEIAKRNLMERPFFRNLERATSPHTHPGSNPLSVCFRLLRTASMFLIRRVLQSSGRETALRQLKDLAGGATDRDILVIGSGPSSSSLNVPEVLRRQRDGSLLVIATNYFLSSSIGKQITPDYLVWSDEVFHPRNRGRDTAWADKAFFPNSRNFDEEWERLEAAREVKVISPWHWKKAVDQTAISGRVLYFDDESLEGLSTNINPTKPRGYQGSTGIKALAIALHMKPRECFIIGIDLSNFVAISIDEDNRILRGTSHISGADSGTQDVTAYSLNGVSDLIYSAASELRYVSTLFPKEGVTNLGKGSLVDAFKRVSVHPLVKA